MLLQLVISILLRTNNTEINMEENKKLYSQRVISIATYFGGPLAAGILIRENYKNLGKEKEAVTSLIIGIVTTLLLFVGLFSVPENIIDKVPNFLIPLIYTGIIYVLVDTFQGEELKSHKENDGEFQSAWKAAAIGAVSLVIIFAGAFFAGDLSNTESDFDYNAYNKGLDGFFENEALALKAFDSAETDSQLDLISKFNLGLAIWQKNLIDIEKLNTIDNLPSEFKEQNEKLFKYCSLRIEQYELVIKAVTESTDTYDDRITNIVQEIDDVIDQMQ